MLNDNEIAQYSVLATKAARKLNETIAKGSPDELITLAADLEFFARKLGWRARDLKYGHALSAEKSANGAQATGTT